MAQLPQFNLSFLSRHLIVALHWVNSLIKRWWPDISANGRGLQQGCLCDGYVQFDPAFLFNCLFICQSLSNLKLCASQQHSGHETAATGVMGGGKSVNFSSRNYG